MMQTTIFESKAFRKVEAFEKFNLCHPEFMRNLIEAARKRKASGGKRWSTKGYFESVRHKYKSKHGVPGLNNNYSSLAARQAIRLAPDLNGFFELR